MQKIQFDAEDHPPLSYYAEKSKSSGEVQSVNTAGSSRVSGEINKSEWWKAPEFVPKSYKVEMPAVHQNPVKPVMMPPPNDIIDSQRKIRQTFQVSPQAGYNMQMPAYNGAMNPGRPYPAPMFSAPQLPRPFLPPMPLLPPIHQMTPFRQFPFRTPNRPYPRAVTLNNNGIPPGYYANMTTINSGLGGQIPAIVIKKKRKKKAKKIKDLFSEHDKSEPNANEQEQELKLTKERSPDDKSSTSTSQIDVGRSDTDLATLRNKIGSVNFPADLDLIQSTANCTMMTGSWPDLSEPQRQILHNTGIYDYFDVGGDDLLESDVFDSIDSNNVMSTSMHNGYLSSKFNEDDELPTENAALLDEAHQLFSADKKRGVLVEDECVKNIMVHSTSEGIKTKIICDEAGNSNLKSARRRTFSLPDVPLAVADGAKVCCCLM